MPDLMGRIDDNSYAFAFDENGRLWSIWKRHPFGKLTHVAEINDMLAVQKSQIGTNEAYRLATNWLTLMSVNIQRLEQRNAPLVKQEFRWRGRVVNGVKDFLPLFEVRWGNWGNSVVQIEIDGRNKEFIDLRLNDETVSERPAPIIKNRGILESITDNEFLSYTMEQRSNLVARFVTMRQTNTDHTSVRAR
jgi:hypothetical protein